MSAADFTDKEVLGAIQLALAERDMSAVAGLMRLLAVKDPAAAQTILDTIELLA